MAIPGSSSYPGSQKSNKGAIAGVTVAGVIVVFFAVVAVFFVLRRRRQQKRTRRKQFGSVYHQPKDMLIELFEKKVVNEAGGSQLYEMPESTTELPA